MEYKESKHVDGENSSSDEKDYISMRILRTELQEFDKLAINFAVKEGKRVTRTDVLREALYRGRPILEQELQEPHVPGVSFVTQKTRLSHFSAVAMRALKIGFEALQNLPSSQS